MFRSKIEQITVFQLVRSRFPGQLKTGEQGRGVWHVGERMEWIKE